MSGKVIKTTLTLVLVFALFLGISRLLPQGFGGLGVLPAPPPEILDFQSLSRTGKPNDFLLCPKEFCSQDPCSRPHSITRTGSYGGAARLILRHDLRIHRLTEVAQYSEGCAKM